MKTKSKWQVGLVYVVLMALLTPTAWAAYNAIEFPLPGDPAGTEYTVDYPIGDAYWYTCAIYDATVNFQAGSSLATWNMLMIADDAVVNFYDCVFEANSNIFITTTSPEEKFNAIVTFYGTEFAIDGVGIKSGDPLPPNVSYEDGKTFCTGNVLSGKNATGEDFEVLVSCMYYGSTAFPEPPMMFFNLEWLGGPSVIDVVVDIKPGSADNTINLGSMGVIPVGILSTADFDATTVDPWTVELAGSGVAVRGKGSKLLSSTKDLNGDGLIDLDVKVETENLDPGLFQDGVAILTGQTYDGLDIQGSDVITIVPAK